MAEIAKLTRIPAPTARRYAALFKDFLGGRKMGRVTKYPEESVTVFERISRYYGEGRVTAEIEDALRTEFPRTIDVEQQPAVQSTEGYAALAETFNGVMGKVASCMEVIADQKGIIDRQQDDIQKLKTAFVLLARSQKKMKELPSAPAVDTIPEDFLKQTEALEKKDAEIEEMALKLTFDTSDIKAKLQILESELVRLRKDRREMEKFLQDKIERLKDAAS